MSNSRLLVWDYATSVCGKMQSMRPAGGAVPRSRAAVRASADASGGGCPMLRTPAYRKRGWRKELNFGQDAAEVQAEILGGDGLCVHWCRLSTGAYSLFPPSAEGNWMTMRALFVGDAALARDVLATKAASFAAAALIGVGLTPSHACSAFRSPSTSATRRTSSTCSALRTSDCCRSPRTARFALRSSPPSSQHGLRLCSPGCRRLPPPA